MSSNNSKGGGSGLAEGSATPRFNIVSPVSGKAYMTAAHKICLRDYPLIVPLFLNGLAPMEMMEHELPLFRRSLVARKSGKYKDGKGVVATESQTVVSYRKQLIDETLLQYKDVCEGDTDAALELLFPNAGYKSRDIKRASIETQAQALMQCLMQLWPSEEVQLTMSLDDDLRVATEINDLIAWTIAFDKFCISNAGNKFFNVREAEQALKSIKMKGYDTANYVRSFKTAAEGARICGSVQSEEDVVAQFFLNLNQASDAFYRYEFRHLDQSDVISSYIKKPLQAALDHALDFHKNTILTAQARKRAGSDSNNTTISSVAELEKVLKAGGSKDNKISVQHSVMVSLMKDSKKRPAPTEREENERKKAKAIAEAKAKAKAKAEAIAKANAEEVEKIDSKSEEVKKCFRFNSKKGCKFGDCKFAHIA